MVVSFGISICSVFVILATGFTLRKISLTTQQHFELDREPLQQLQQLEALKRYYFDNSDNIVCGVLVIAMLKILY